jgi:RNA polymerase sigma-70 factor, ECF subfamily
MESLNETAPIWSSEAKAPQPREAVARTPRTTMDLEALLTEVRPRAFSVALRVLRNPDDAEDAVQEAFLKVWRNFDRFEGRASFTTWVHRIVVNASLDLRRRQHHRTESQPDGTREELGEVPAGVVELVTEQTPETMLGRAEAGALVGSALATLSPQHRQALTLREFEERSYEEIAEVSRCPVGTVMSRLHHARRKLAEELRATLADDAQALCAA